MWREVIGVSMNFNQQIKTHYDGLTLITRNKWINCNPTFILTLNWAPILVVVIGLLYILKAVVQMAAPSVLLHPSTKAHTRLTTADAPHPQPWRWPAAIQQGMVHFKLQKGRWHPLLRRAVILFLLLLFSITKLELTILGKKTFTSPFAHLVTVIMAPAVERARLFAKVINVKNPWSVSTQQKVFCIPSKTFAWLVFQIHKKARICSFWRLNQNKNKMIVDRAKTFQAQLSTSLIKICTIADIC